jgi:short-subunit dehydrogenase
MLNGLSHLELAHAFGSWLRGWERRGGILFVSSTAALQPIALAANYSASKAFLRNLGESLHSEFAEVGIDVTVLLPGPTDTAGLNDRSDIAMGELPMAAMPVDVLVRQGLAALAAGRVSHIAGWTNWWTAWLPRRVLAWMFTTLLRRNASPHLLPTAPLADATGPAARLDLSAAR